MTDDVRHLLAARLGATAPFIFCLPADQPIRRTEPFKPEWLSQAGAPAFRATCRPGEYLIFQIGVLAQAKIDRIVVSFSPLKGKNNTLSDGDCTCFSLGGIDLTGKQFQKQLSIDAGALQPLWCGVQVSKTALGEYAGQVSVATSAQTVTAVPLHLNVQGPPLEDPDDADPKDLGRLRWLNSTAGQSDSITKPFVPIRVSGRSIHVLGRDLILDETGLFATLTSHFASNNASLTSRGKPILAKPMRFSIVQDGIEHPLEAKLTEQHASKTEVTWEARGMVHGWVASVQGRVDYTGSGQIKIKVDALQDLPVDDMRLDIPYAEDSSKYLMGLNRKGGLRPSTHTWQWDVSRHQDCFWLGDVNAGLMVRLKDQNFHRPLLNIYYSFLPLALPASWGNEGKGGVRIAEESGHVLASAFSGPRKIAKGQTLEFIFDFYVTPFRMIDTEKQWATRFVHPGGSHDPKPLDDALKSSDPTHGPNVINVHQATYYNPYINYPYSPDSFEEFTRFVKQGHDKGVRTKVYYTTREITQNMPELYALHSLNGEIIFPGPGKDARTLINPKGPNPWLVNNLGSDFIPAWVDHVGGKYAEDDISVITRPDSRWNNFYLEGLKWMVRKAKIDGVYIDDTALDAQSLRRARRILAERPDPFIDLHSWNHFNEYAGFANNLNMYMEVLPYLDRLWLGEGFSANDASPDYWLVEMSGLPFGLMSEMLDSPNAIRGLVFGETGRLGWSGDPRPIWKLFDDFGIKGTDMEPFFDPHCPVKTGRHDVLATVYKAKGRSLLVLGNWSGADLELQMQVDWKALGLNSEKSKAVAPEVAGVQSARSLSLTEPISVPKSGLILVLSE